MALLHTHGMKYREASTDQVKSGGKEDNFKENKLCRSVHFRKNGNIRYLSLSLQCLELS
jgi:hypothetical protein